MSNLSNTDFHEPGVTRLTQFALIRASGADASSFLHSQLTNDINSLTAGKACLAGYCTAKGRLLATMLVWKTDEAVFLQVPQELRESFQKRLQMYVMRAKVKLEHISTDLSLFGLFGVSMAQQLTQWFPDLPATPYDASSNAHGTLIRLTDLNGMARYQCSVTDTVAAHLDQLGATHKMTESDWMRSEIHAGIPRITAATLEKFVPQMLNYELIGGVNFKKGCYPGQEIVARTHYLGKQKRRTVLARIASPEVQSGMEVFASADPDQPCGLIVNAEKNNAGGSDCLIELKTDFLNNTTVSLPGGEICEWLAMPYSLPDDSADAH